ncbi:hypothetical protein ACFL5L_05270 [candidate division KSB1 bacterium]
MPSLNSTTGNFNIYSFIYSAPEEFEKYIMFDRYLKIRYAKGIDWIEYDNMLSKTKYMAMQTSYIELMREKVLFNVNGILSEPHLIMTYGYLSRKRVADLLPVEYLPLEKREKK